MSRLVRIQWLERRPREVLVEAGSTSEALAKLRRGECGVSYAPLDLDETGVVSFVDGTQEPKTWVIRVRESEVIETVVEAVTRDEALALAKAGEVDWHGTPDGSSLDWDSVEIEERE